MGRVQAASAMAAAKDVPCGQERSSLARRTGFGDPHVLAETPIPSTVARAVLSQRDEVRLPAADQMWRLNSPSRGDLLARLHRSGRAVRPLNDQHRWSCPGDAAARGMGPCQSSGGRVTLSVESAMVQEDHSSFVDSGSKTVNQVALVVLSAFSRHTSNRRCGLGAQTAFAALRKWGPRIMRKLDGWVNPYERST
jgi:hypothetical protein